MLLSLLQSRGHYWNSSDDESHGFSSLANELKIESLETIEKISTEVMGMHAVLDQKLQPPEESTQSLFRSLHTLKGLMGMAELTLCMTTIHKAEDSVGLIRDGKAKISEELLILLSELQTVMEKVMGSYPTPLEVDDKNELERLNKLFTDLFFALSFGEEFKLTAKTEDAAKPETPQTQEASPTTAASKETPSEPIKIETHDAEDDGELEDFDSVNLAKPPEASDLDPEILQDFLTNADELLDKLSQSMLELEKDSKNKEAIEAIFRNAHTIKGTAGMFGFKAIEKLTHTMENLFDRVRKGSLDVDSKLMDGLLLGLDKVKGMFESIKKNQSSELPINDALKLLSLKSENSSKMSEKASQPSTPAPSPVSSQETSKKEAEAPAKTDAPKETAPAGQGVHAPQVAQAAAPANPDGGTLRVDLKRIDMLVNLIGELVIDKTRFSQIEEKLRALKESNGISHTLSETLLLFSRHMNEVQSIIMKIRMVPVGNAFFKFTRVVRDLARQLGKEVDLVIEGGDTELDKTLVEEIGDPLVHLIRNSVDHGIELPEVREAAGKPRKGKILLKASQDGNMIIITIADDGKGLQVEKIKQKGIEKGLIKEELNISDKEIFGLIFEAGFSTAEKVTNVSGRGVGMDVVKKNIVKLKGIIDLDSQVGKGTTTTIKLPLTLAILPSLMVQSAGEVYAVPLVNVIESIRIKPSDVQVIGGAEFVSLREKVIPLLHLSKAFGLDKLDEQMWYKDSNQEHRNEVANRKSNKKSKNIKQERLVFVVVEVGEKRMGLIVDSLKGQQEIVIKSIGNILKRQRGIAGGCVMGNGHVALVLDLAEVIEDVSAQFSPQMSLYSPEMRSIVTTQGI